jgi:CBS domain-containing protein
MAAILAGTMRAPLTALVFAIELTGRFRVSLPILTAGIVAHTFTVLILKRSILTEKVARRGYHVSREYAIDPLEILFVREVMRPEVVVLSGESPVAGAAELLTATARARAQRLFPVTDARGGLIGVVTRADIEGAAAAGAPIATIARTPIVAVADEPVRAAIHRMAESGVSRLPVVDRSVEPPALLGLVTLKGALKARARHLEVERRRERVLPLDAIIPIARLLPVRAPADRQRKSS